MQYAQLIPNIKTLLVLLSVCGGLLSCSSSLQQVKHSNMHPSWDADGDGINDCEKQGSCDHNVDYTKPRPVIKPSFSCAKGTLNSAETLICQSPELASLDVKLAKVYKQAVTASKEPKPGPSFLQMQQRGWIKGRNACWKDDEFSQCIKDEYIRRIAQLQALYRLVGSSGPIRFECSDSPADELVVTYFDTEPRTLISERGDSVSWMYQIFTDSGVKYIGRNERLSEHQGEIRLEWGPDKTELVCQQVSE